MADRKMLLSSRWACEFLRTHPASTRYEVAVGIGRSYDSTKKMLARLVRDGFVARNGNYRATYSLTGKIFPASADYSLSPKYEEAVKSRTLRPTFTRTEIDAVFYEMVRGGIAQSNDRGVA